MKHSFSGKSASETSTIDDEANCQLEVHSFSDLVCLLYIECQQIRSWELKNRVFELFFKGVVNWQLCFVKRIDPGIDSPWQKSWELTFPK